MGGGTRARRSETIQTKLNMEKRKQEHSWMMKQRWQERTKKRK